MKSNLLKKLFIFIIFGIFTLFIASCEMGGSTSIAVPEDLEINDTIISFKEVEGATKYRIEIRNIETEEILKRFVENGTDLDSLNIPEGKYMIKIQAMNDNNNESKFSEEVAYSQKDLYLVNSIEGEQLIDGKYIKWMGRTSYNATTKANTMYYTAAGFSVNVKKVEEDLTLTATVTATNYNISDKMPYIVLVLDDDFENTITLNLSRQTNEVVLVGDGGFSITDEEVHKVSLYKRSESIDSHIALKKLVTSGKFIEGVTYKERKIEVIAASSSTGYGNLSATAKTTATSDGLHAFAFLSALALDAEINIVSASGWGIYASRWTSPQTINMHDKYFNTDVSSNEVWDTTKYVPDLIVVNFGTNDLSYINLATDSVEKAKRIENFISMYVDFVKKLKATYNDPEIIILYGLMNESGIYAEHEEIFDRLSEYEGIYLLKINGDAKGYNSHPSVTSHAEIAETLTAKIREIEGWE